MFLPSPWKDQAWARKDGRQEAIHDLDWMFAYGSEFKDFLREKGPMRVLPGAPTGETFAVDAEHSPAAPLWCGYGLARSRTPLCSAIIVDSHAAQAMTLYS